MDGCMINAILELYLLKKDPKYLEFADAFIDYFVQEDGQILSYSPEEYNLDNVNAGKTLFDLYELTGKEKYRKAIDTVYSQLKGQPRTSTGNFWHKKIYPNQIWLDGLYTVSYTHLDVYKRQGIAGQIPVIKSNQGNVLRNRKPPFRYCHPGAKRHLVIKAKQGCRLVVQQPFCCLIAAFVTVVSTDYRNHVRIKAVASHRLSPASVSQTGRVQIRLSFNDSNASVAIV